MNCEMKHANEQRQRATDIWIGAASTTPEGVFARLRRGVLSGPGAALFATFCATSATASFMANDFHELSPYVLSAIRLPWPL